jgi:hypothetical protein
MKRRNQKTKTSTFVSRRKFLTTTAATVAGFTLVPRHVLGGPKFVAPSEKVNIAIVGCGGQGQVNVRNLFTQADAQIIAVADPIDVPGFARILLQHDVRPFAAQGGDRETFFGKRRPITPSPITKISG